MLDVSVQVGKPVENSGITIVAERGSDVCHGANGHVALSVHGNGGRIFKRCAIKRAMTPSAHKVEWLVGELNGVRVYVDGSTIIMTTQDLNP